MRINLPFNKNKDETQGQDQVLAVTSLVYLQEALAKEQYEQCAELVRAAKGFGATQSEIKKVLAQAATGLKFGRKAEAPYEKVAGRKRF